MSLAVSLPAGLALSLLIGATAYRRGALTRSGVLGAVLTGTAIFGFGGLIPGILLVAFFISSSLLSHYRARLKARFEGSFEKGSRRDLGQALANGGWAAVLAVALSVGDRAGWDPHQRTILFSGLVGALATATADTWATEIGVLSAVPPRMITTGHPVPAGTSGAITRIGTAMAFSGGLFIGWLAFLGYEFALYAGALLHLDLLGPSPLGPASALPALYLLIGCIAGLGGALFDSWLGATVQGIYVCEYDEMQTERKIHTCGRTTRLVRGWRWLDNDLVNLLASLFGSALAACLALAFL